MADLDDLAAFLAVAKAGGFRDVARASVRERRAALPKSGRGAFLSSSTDGIVEPHADRRILTSHDPRHEDAEYAFWHNVGPKKH